MTTQNMNLFEKHQTALNSAITALSARTYFTPYPENPRAYAEDADAKAKAWMSAAMNNDFTGLHQTGEIAWSGEEVSPFLQVGIGVKYPLFSVESLINNANNAQKSWSKTNVNTRACFSSTIACLILGSAKVSGRTGARGTSPILFITRIKRSQFAEAICTATSTSMVTLSTPCKTHATPPPKIKSTPPATNSFRILVCGPMGVLLRFGRDRLFAKIVLQQARMADEGRVEGRGGDIKTGVPIEKSKTENIGPEKSPEGPKGSLGRCPLCFFLKPRF